MGEWGSDWMGSEVQIVMGPVLKCISNKKSIYTLFFPPSMNHGEVCFCYSSRSYPAKWARYFALSSNWVRKMAVPPSNILSTALSWLCLTALTLGSDLGNPLAKIQRSKPRMWDRRFRPPVFKRRLATHRSSHEIKFRIRLSVFSARPSFFTFQWSGV